jgi:hypothetical protein
VRGRSGRVRSGQQTVGWHLKRSAPAVGLGSDRWGGSQRKNPGQMRRNRRGTDRRTVGLSPCASFDGLPPLSFASSKTKASNILVDVGVGHIFHYSVSKVLLHEQFLLTSFEVVLS